MTSTHRHLFSRRGFCPCCVGSATFAATGVWLTPSQFLQRPGDASGGTSTEVHKYAMDHMM